MLTSFSSRTSEWVGVAAVAWRAAPPVNELGGKESKVACSEFIIPTLAGDKESKTVVWPIN